MTDHDAGSPQVSAFIDRWSRSGGAERANSQLFLAELCDLLGVDRPQPAVGDPASNAYTFERPVTRRYHDGSTSNGFIDLYRRGCFVLESKQAILRRDGSAKPADVLMERARNQAETYIRALEPAEGRPPFLITCDVGHQLELYAEFSRTGGTYTPFPDPRSHRLRLTDLASDEIRARLRAVWTNPDALNPALRSATVTRDVSRQLAELAVALEQEYEPEAVALFLMRSIFCMFAEDAELLEAGTYSGLLERCLDRPAEFQLACRGLWTAMKDGQRNWALAQRIPHFNGPLFEQPRALELNRAQIQGLLDAARADWRQVDPSIFGTLLERALDRVERHKLGAHYTPRGYVERLVLPTVIEPLREEWDTVRAACAAEPSSAIERLRRFHAELCELRVLDPACGTGNFLYVTLEHLKRLEGEVLDALAEAGDTQATLAEGHGTIRPRQFLGLEINPRAAAIAELVIWIGYLQWHLRAIPDKPAEPILQDEEHIKVADAVLDHDEKRQRLDEHGRPVMRWDGTTRKAHHVTGQLVPDEAAVVRVYDYPNPRPATWPEADFVVGNPPFIGKHLQRDSLGDGYIEALRKVYRELPDSCDYVMYWWHKAAGIARQGERLRRFGFITTNSLRQTFNRRVMAAHLGGEPPLSLSFAIPDHPWVDEKDGANVRIAMTVGSAGEHDGLLQTVVAETPRSEGARDVTLESREGRINADLTVGVDLTKVQPLKANEGICSFGMMLAGAGFIVTPEQAAALGLGRVVGLDEHIRPYRNGRDLADKPRGAMVIDLFGLTAEDVRDRFPEVYQWVADRVRTEREGKAGKGGDVASYARKWWLFAKPRPEFRPALVGLRRYIVTVETAKHRWFVFQGYKVIADHSTVSVASDDAYHLGILSSRPHVVWALAAGGRMGIGNDPRYNKSRCFDPFPFPPADEAQRAVIRDLGERLDAHRKSRQALHPGLTLTAMYNVLARLRAGEPLSDSERAVHDQGLVGLLREIHDELDQAVAAAYGWPADLPDDALLARLVALNAERAAEERQGTIRWLRPAYQAPGEAGETAAQGTLGGTDTPKPTAPADRVAWPATLPERIAAVRAELTRAGRPITLLELRTRFVVNTDPPAEKSVSEVVDVLIAVGRCERLPDARVVGG